MYIGFLRPKPDAIGSVQGTAGAMQRVAGTQTAMAPLLDGVFVDNPVRLRASPTNTLTGSPPAFDPNAGAIFIVDLTATAERWTVDSDALTRMAWTPTPGYPACTPPPGFDPCLQFWINAGREDEYWRLWTPAAAASPTKPYFVTMTRTPAPILATPDASEEAAEPFFGGAATSEAAAELGANERSE